ncbi:MFS transporter [Actinophytocola oryzae]|uniref:Fucose permease n=1 Tax=Actinophytocola oryzae TaxID=502181 RepID=A0A4R7VV51_9PSEU|nr:MFS transporter [Actinophytocola oryzae]TDV53883.1 fucose permease [Actinophytocola oryzae]
MVVRCALVFGLLGLFQATLGPLIPLLSDRQHLEPATAGLIVTGFFGGSLVSTAIGGALSDRWARGPLYVVCAVLLLGGLVLFALPLSWPLPLGAVVVAGLGFGGLVLIINAVTAARGLAHVNLVNGAYGLGAAAGPALVSLTHGGYLFAVVAVCLVGTLPLRLAAPAAPPAHERLTVGPTLLLFCALLFSYAGVETGLSSWEATQLRAHGYAPDTASALTSLFWLGLATGRLLVPLVTRNWTAVRLLVTTLLACAASLTLITVDVSAPTGYFLLGMFAGPVFPTTLAWIAATLPHPRRVTAVVLTVAMLGNSVVPTVIGFGMQATSDLALPLFVAVAMACCLGVVVALSRTQRVASRE